MSNKELFRKIADDLAEKVRTNPSFLMFGEKELLYQAVLAGVKVGYGMALKDYSWWQDGVEFVGSGMKTLKEVKEELGIE